MRLDRRTIVRSAVFGCMAAGLKPLTLLSQAISPDEFEVIAAVLKAQCDSKGKHPVLMAAKPFDSARITVLSKKPSSIQLASRQVEMPNLYPPAERMAEAEELAATYNRSLEEPATPISESAAFTFPHRVLDEEAVAQFEALNSSEAVYSPGCEAKRRAVPSRYRRLFAGSTTLWTVSRVGLASSGTLAVVGLRGSAGCMEEDWKVLERSQGAWHELRWGEGLMTCA